MRQHPWPRRLVLLGVLVFLMDLGGPLMVAAIDVDGGTSVLFVEMACRFISDVLASIVEMALACNW